MDNFNLVTDRADEDELTVQKTEKNETPRILETSHFIQNKIYYI
jgi:hypothetical protein